MSDNYAKVFRTMYTGSLYGAGMHVFAVWGWILSHKDVEGRVEINPRLVAGELGGTVEQVAAAIEYLMAPDPESRSKQEDGRRLKQVGQFEYEVVNHGKYRDRGGSRAEYWRQYRAKKKAEEDGAMLRNVARNETAHDTDANADVDTKVKSGNKDNNESGKSAATQNPPDAAPLDFPDSTRLGYRQELRDVLRIGCCAKLEDPASANRGLDSFERWLHTNVTSGRFGLDCYARAMEIAQDCVKSNVPYAAFMGRVQEQMNYVPPTKK